MAPAAGAEGAAVLGTGGTAAAIAGGGLFALVMADQARSANAYADFNRLMQATNDDLKQVHINTSRMNKASDLTAGIWDLAQKDDDASLNAIFMALKSTGQSADLSKDETDAIHQLWQDGRITSKGQLQQIENYWNAVVTDSGGIPPTVAEIKNWLDRASGHASALDTALNVLSTAVVNHEQAINSQLDNILNSLSDAATGAAHGGGGHAGSVKALASGGWITEPVYGVGARTGMGYRIAESGPEFVSNPQRGVGQNALSAFGHGAGDLVGAAAALSGAGSSTTHVTVNNPTANVDVLQALEQDRFLARMRQRGIVPGPRFGLAGEPV